MNGKINEVRLLQNIEKIYEEVFTRNGMGKFMQLAWLNVKGEYSEEPNILDVCIRLMIEELIVYTIAVNGKEGYEEIRKTKSVKNIELILKPYEDVKNYYKKYIEMLEEYFRNNPEKKSSIFEIED